MDLGGSGRPEYSGRRGQVEPWYLPTLLHSLAQPFAILWWPGDTPGSGLSSLRGDTPGAAGGAGRGPLLLGAAVQGRALKECRICPWSIRCWGRAGAAGSLGPWPRLSFFSP